jgi:D-alanine transaminase
MSLPFTPFLPAAVDYAGEKAISHEDIRWHRCHLKTTSLLPNVLLSQQAKEADAIEVILVRDGVVTEGSASNVFAVIEGVLMTHPQGPAILGGITRDVVLELAEQQQLKVQQQPISLDQLRQAEEVWISSSTKEIRPVVELDGQPVAKGKPGAYWRKVAQAYQERRDQ